MSSFTYFVQCTHTAAAANLYRRLFNAIDFCLYVSLACIRSLVLLEFFSVLNKSVWIHVLSFIGVCFDWKSIRLSCYCHHCDFIRTVDANFLRIQYISSSILCKHAVFSLFFFRSKKKCSRTEKNGSFVLYESLKSHGLSKDQHLQVTLCLWLPTFAFKAGVSHFFLLSQYEFNSSRRVLLFISSSSNCWMFFVC